jgi:hypothetical protein
LRDAGKQTNPLGQQAQKPLIIFLMRHPLILRPDSIFLLPKKLHHFRHQNAGLNGFFLEGEYNDAASAELAFDNLTEPLVNDWAEWANPVKTNQVWVYRSADEHYAKLRIIATFSEARDPRDFASCTFEWVYQPDGSLTFPGK